MERVNVRRLPDDWGAEEEALLHAIDATATPIYIAYHLVPEWCDGLHAAIDELEVFATRRADVGLALIEHLGFSASTAPASTTPTAASPKRSGASSPVHARTASAHREDPNALADRLVQFAHTLDVEPFDNAVTTHGDVLGRTGLSAIIITSAEARRAAGSGDAVVDRLIADARAALREGA